MKIAGILNPAGAAAARKNAPECMRVYNYNRDFIYQTEDPGVFFSAYGDLIRAIESLKKYAPYAHYKNFDINGEYARFVEGREAVIDDFIDRSYKAAAGEAASRKTPRGRAGVMKKYFTAMEENGAFLSDGNRAHLRRLEELAESVFK